MDQKNEQDLTVGLDGAMTEGATQTAPAQDLGTDAAQPPPAAVAPSEPSVNSIAPPPSDENVLPPEVESAPVHDPSSGVVQAPDDDISSKVSPELTPEQEAPSKPEVASAAAITDNKKADKTQEYSQTSQNTASQHRPHEHRNNKKLAVFMTIFIALLLAAAAVFVYVSAQDNASPQQPVTEPITAPTEMLPAEDEVTSDPLVDEIVQEPPTDLVDPAGENESVENTPAPVPEQSVQ